MFENIRKRFAQFSIRERRIIIAGIVIIVGYLAYVAVFEPLYRMYQLDKDKLDQEMRLFEKNLTILRKREQSQYKLRQVERMRRMVESGLLSGESAELASANLQAIIKNYAREIGIDIDRVSPSPPKVRNGYKEIRIKLPFRCDVEKLKNFLFMIENSERFLFVPTLDVSVPNPRNPKTLRVNLEVAGFIQQEEEETASDT